MVFDDRDTKNSTEASQQAMAVTRLNDSLSLIMIGSFNPAIFQPEWFARHGLLPDTEVADSKIEVVHPDVAEFTTHWLSWQALRTRVMVSTSDATQFPRLRDLLLGTFLLLPQTPITAFGINLGFHLRFENRERCDAFAYRFAPQKGWEGLLADTKLRRLHVECPAPDVPGAKFGVIIEPSAIAVPGAYINLNTHFDTDIDGLLSTLKDHWDQVLGFARVFGNRLKDLEQ